MSYELYWLLPSETPTINNGTIVIVESLNGTMYVDFIGPDFDSWSDDIVRWAYFPDQKYARYQNALSDVKYYKEENEKLKKDVDDWFNKYLDLLGKQHNEHQRDAFVGKRSKFAIDDCCGDIRDAYIRASEVARKLRQGDR